MTQEQIANTLGVRRESVTEAAGKLQKQGVIEYSCGHPITQFLTDFHINIDIADLKVASAAIAVETKKLQLRLLNGCVEPVQIKARPLSLGGNPALIVIIERVDRKVTPRSAHSMSR